MIINYTYTMMLLIGMWISLTKKPMKPIMQKPMAVAIAIFWNSVKSNQITQIKKVQLNGIQIDFTFSVGFSASFYQPNRIFGKLASGFQHFSYLIHVFLLFFVDEIKSQLVYSTIFYSNKLTWENDKWRQWRLKGVREMK